MDKFKIILTEEQLLDMRVCLQNDLDYVKNQQKFREELMQETNELGKPKYPDVNLEHWTDREKSTMELIEMLRKAVKVED